MITDGECHDDCNVYECGHSGCSVEEAAAHCRQHMSQALRSEPSLRPKVTFRFVPSELAIFDRTQPEGLALAILYSPFILGARAGAAAASVLPPRNKAKQMRAAAQDMSPEQVPLAQQQHRQGQTRSPW